MESRSALTPAPLSTINHARSLSCRRPHCRGWPRGGYVCKCACSCRGQRPDHRQAVNTAPMTAIAATQRYPILCFVDQLRSLLGRQTASNRERSKCCRQVNCSSPQCAHRHTWPLQSYGLADRLLSQAAMMVMAVSENTLFSGSSPLTLCRHSIIPVQMESRSGPLCRVFQRFTHLPRRLSL